MHPEWSEAQVEKRIAELSTQLLEDLTHVLSGKENAGKFFHTVDITDETGTTHTWKIEAIDQKIKDFVDRVRRLLRLRVPLEWDSTLHCRMLW